MRDCCGHEIGECVLVLGRLGEEGRGRGSVCRRVYKRECIAACEVDWSEAFWDQEGRLRMAGCDEGEENLERYGKTASVRVDVWMR